MKYRLINTIDIFEFHDAIAKLISYKEDHLVVGVECLNVHKDTEQNPYEFDMEIEYAEISLKKLTVHSYTDADSKQYEGRDAIHKLMDQITKDIIILSFGLEKDNIYYLEGCGSDPFFLAYISFENICIEWDKYKKKAWYELIRRYENQLCLETQIGDTLVDLSIIFNEEIEGEEIVSLIMKYNDKEYFEYGNDYGWFDSFAKLQNQLPEDVKIKSCLTCRHGNMCPVGNTPGEIFCTKDVKVSRKSDLYFYTEDDTEREKRLRFYTDVCGDFKIQSEEYYTYNDYLYWSNKTK